MLSSSCPEQLILGLYLAQLPAGPEHWPFPSTYPFLVEIPNHQAADTITPEAFPPLEEVFGNRNGPLVSLLLPSIGHSVWILQYRTPMRVLPMGRLLPASAAMHPESAPLSRCWLLFWASPVPLLYKEMLPVVCILRIRLIIFKCGVPHEADSSFETFGFPVISGDHMGYVSPQGMNLIPLDSCH